MRGSSDRRALRVSARVARLFLRALARHEPARAQRTLARFERLLAHAASSPDALLLERLELLASIAGDLRRTSPGPAHHALLAHLARSHRPDGLQSHQ